MADILIRGMEIPKNCSSCKIVCWNYLEYGINGILGKLSTSESRDPNCPLDQLPEGHGRLGDLDALQEEFKKSHDGKRLILIDTAPTIIEADLEWKMKNCCCFSNTDQAEGGTDDGNE